MGADGNHTGEGLDPEHGVLLCVPLGNLPDFSTGSAAPEQFLHQVEHGKGNYAGRSGAAGF